MNNANTASNTASASLQTIAIFGATRGIGRLVMDQALERGHRVTALVRRAGALPGHPNLRTVLGDAENAHDVARTIAGADAVVSALGAPPLSKSRVRSEGTRQIVRAMERADIDRLVAISLYGARETRTALPFFERYLLFPLYLRRTVADHERQERIVEASRLAWTLIRPPHLTDGPRTGAYAHGFGTDLAGTTLRISRADVADFVLRELEAPSYIGQAAALSNLEAAPDGQVIQGTYA